MPATALDILNHGTGLLEVLANTVMETPRSTHPCPLMQDQSMRESTDKYDTPMSPSSHLPHGVFVEPLRVQGVMKEGHGLAFLVYSTCLRAPSIC